MEWAIATAVVISVVCVVGWFVREDIRKAREAELRRDQRYQEALLRQLAVKTESVYAPLLTDTIRSNPAPTAVQNRRKRDSEGSRVSSSPYASSPPAQSYYGDSSSSDCGGSDSGSSDGGGCGGGD